MHQAYKDAFALEVRLPRARGRVPRAPATRAEAGREGAFRGHQPPRRGRREPVERAPPARGASRGEVGRCMRVEVFLRRL